MKTNIMKDKNKTSALALTLFFTGGMIVVLILFGFVTPLPLPEEQGVEIESAGGGGGGSSGGIVEANQESVSSDEDIATQDDEEAPVINKDNKNKKVVHSEPVKETPKADSRITSIKWGQGSGMGTGQGSGRGSGTGPGSGSGTGGGNESGNGPGDGPSYSLGKRGAKSIPVPSYDEPEQGKVVVTIYVDKDGNVLRAVPGGIGTTVSNPSLWAKAKSAALKAKFAKDPDASEEQKGTITYYFIRQN